MMGYVEHLGQAAHLRAWLLVTSIVVLLVVIRKVSSHYSLAARRLRNLPVVRENNDDQLRVSISRAFSNLSQAGKFYKLAGLHDERVILPPQFMSEMKSLPDSSANFKAELYDRVNGELTGLGVFEPSFMKTIVSDLSKRVPRLLSELADECDYVMQGWVRNGSQAQAVTMLSAAQRIIATLNSRAFIGLSVSRNEEWLTAIIAHTQYAFHASRVVWKYPKCLRAFIAPYTEEFRKMESNRRIVEDIIAPEVAARQKAAFSEDNDFDDILQCLIRNAPVNRKGDIRYHAANQLEMSVAGIHTTAQMLTLMIFNLAAHPECIDELREELFQTLKHSQTQPRSLVATKSRLAKCVKLDSFMKETQRHFPIGIIGMNRRINAADGITLSNGLHLPYGTYTAVNSYNIVQDPSLYPDPQVFDPFRFSKRAASGKSDSTRHQFTSINPEFIAFGYGNHSCPGRFFAAAELKVILTYILLNFEVAFEAGQSLPRLVTRGVLQSPNPQTKVVFTPREDAWMLAGEVE